MLENPTITILSDYCQVNPEVARLFVAHIKLCLNSNGYRYFSGFFLWWAKLWDKRKRDMQNNLIIWMVVCVDCQHSCC